jgi:(S)-2-hydroxy-acid oxidase
MANQESKPITIDELEAIAKQKLPSNVYNYYSCGSDDQKCVKRNRDAFDRYGLIHKSTRTSNSQLTFSKTSHPP